MCCRAGVDNWEAPVSSWRPGWLWKRWKEMNPSSETCRGERVRGVLTLCCLHHGQGQQDSSIPNEPYSCPAEHVSGAAPSPGKGRMVPGRPAAEYPVMQLWLSLQWSPEMGSCVWNVLIFLSRIQQELPLGRERGERKPSSDLEVGEGNRVAGEKVGNWGSL